MGVAALKDESGVSSDTEVAAGMLFSLSHGVLDHGLSGGMQHENIS